MNTKLTLSIPKREVDFAKRIAKKRGKSVSKMVEDYFSELKRVEEEAKKVNDPLINDLAGIISTGSDDIMADIFGKKRRL
ncbi:MAG: DUF6364 family protein [Chitinophagaceae bacterium]|jgi:hypothetical protein|nr:DUF6364 family protein [Chitinophagaceae bacterium]